MEFFGPYTYLITNILSISIPLLVSLHPKSHFHGKWKSFFPAVCLTGLFFISWDVAFTSIGIWSFNPDYLTGISFLGLPIEEYLFFICIPYACIYTYTFIQSRLSGYKQLIAKGGQVFTILLIFFMTIVSIIYFSKLYTFVLASSFLLFLIWLSQSKFKMHAGYVYLAYLPLLIPFYLVNGTLTGMYTDEPIVMYNNLENSGLRWETIPIEDIFYGLFLITSTAIMHEYFELKINKVLTGQKANYSNLVTKIHKQ